MIQTAISQALWTIVDAIVIFLFVFCYKHRRTIKAVEQKIIRDTKLYFYLKKLERRGKYWKKRSGDAIRYAEQISKQF